MLKVGIIGVGVMGGGHARFIKEHIPDATIVALSDLATEKMEKLATELGNTVTGETSKRDFTGLFVAIGHIPRSELVTSQVTLNEEGYVSVEGRSTRTNLKGVFACGDLVDYTYRQAITAAGSGCQAALDAEKFLSH